MSSSLADKQNDLQARVDAIDQEIGECDTAFTELALQFSGLDGKESLKQAAQLETRLAALRREKSLALAAQAHITRDRQGTCQRDHYAER